MSFAVNDLDKTIDFYCNVLKCNLGRKGTDWVDIDFFGHQLTAVVRPKLVVPARFYKGKKNQVPIRHFGVVLSWKDWHSMKDRFEKEKVAFAISPLIMFEGTVAEQASMFLRDPNGYAIEFKAFEKQENLFRSA
ncbi:MAG: VOC family protein [Salibacteraceae bacterium]